LEGAERRGEIVEKLAPAATQTVANFCELFEAVKLQIIF